MIDKPGGGVGQNTRDLKAGKAITSYDDWYASVKSCMQRIPMSYGCDGKQGAALVRDVQEIIRAK